MPGHILIILGHPRTESYCGALAHRYAEAARAAGAETRILKVAEMEFNATRDVDYWSGTWDPAALEPSIHEAMDSIRWADRITWVYPLWWGFMPALLKGFIDRVLAVPEFAAEYDENRRPVGLLAPRTSTLVVTMDAPVFWERWFMRNRGVGVMRNSILKFCGIKVDRLIQIGGMDSADTDKRTKALDRVSEAGKKDGLR